MTASLEEIATAAMPSFRCAGQWPMDPDSDSRNAQRRFKPHFVIAARERCNAAMLSSLLFFLLNALITGVVASTGYHERLFLRPLPQGTLLASFNFLSNETQAAFEQQNFRYFPRSFGQILQHAHAKELHLRFSVGRWDAESWGERPWNGAREGGTGVELWAWVEADNEEECDTLLILFLYTQG